MSGQENGWYRGYNLFVPVRDKEVFLFFSTRSKIESSGNGFLIIKRIKRE